MVADMSLERRRQPPSTTATKAATTGCHTRRVACSVLLLAAVGLVTACGSSDGPAANEPPSAARQVQLNKANTKTPLVVLGGQTFTEQLILQEIYAQAWQAAGYRVDQRPTDGGAEDQYGRLTAGEVGASPEYLGTFLLTVDGSDIASIPKDADTAFAEVQAAVAPDGIQALTPTPFSDSNGFAVRREDATALSLRRLSDLEDDAPDLVLSGPPECAERQDCLLGLEQVYGLRFKEFLPVEIPERHTPLVKGTADVGLVFTTDGQIRAEGLVLLEDDREMLPAYNVSLLVRDDVLDAAGPDLAEVAEAVQEDLTTSVMQELNARVDLDQETPRSVARQYLRQAGFVP